MFLLVSVCLSARLLKRLRTDFGKIFFGVVVVPRATVD